LDYAEDQRRPAKHLPSVLFVIAMHLALGYALVTGLARKVVEIIKAPIETKIIEEIKKELPDTPPPPPKLAPPPPPFIPPPEVNIQVPVAVQQAPTITTTTVKPPLVAPPPPPRADPGVVRRNVVPVARVNPIFPRDAIKRGIEKGVVIAHVYVKADGTVSDVKIVSANPARVFDREVLRALAQWRFAPEPVGFIGEIEIEFKLTD
jgi:protein TonB